MNDDAELLAIFKAEVGAQLDAIEDLLAIPPSAWNFDELFHLAHNIKGAARMTLTPGLMEAGHALEDLLSALRRGRPSTEQTTKLVREGADVLRLCFSALSGKEMPDYATYVARVAEEMKRGSDTSTAPTNAHTQRVEEIALEELPRTQPWQREAENEGTSTIRIAVQKLDTLMGLSAELLISLELAEAQRETALKLVSLAERLRRSVPALQKNPDFNTLLASTKTLSRKYQEEGARGEQVSKQLQDAIRMLRMVRTDTLHGVLNRVVRGAAQAEGKEIQFTMAGGETEIDRAVLDKLRDPLVHIVRNAVAHGIESAEARRAVGKPEKGKIELRAYAAGSWVEIVVSDDGSGIDVERVKQKAVELSVIDERQAAACTREELMELVFHPGLSTAHAVTNLAGRGIGMDVVRARVIEVGGSVAISSRDGQGTEFRLRAPLTRLTTRALVITVAGQPMALPMMSVERALLLDRSQIRMVEGGQVASIMGDLVRTSSLAGALGFEHTMADTTKVVVLSEGHRRGAFLVDEVIGERELTMQALGFNLQHVKGVAGGAVLETGEVALVLNAHELLGMKGVVSMEQQAPLPHANRKPRMLVVDDSVTSRTLEKNILSSAGYEVVMATNGEAALELLNHEEVDLVITDVDMPKMNGIELITRLRASNDHQRLPIVLVTSLGGEEDRKRGAVAGADAYIVKGEFDQDELLRAVERLL